MNFRIETVGIRVRAFTSPALAALMLMTCIAPALHANTVGNSVHNLTVNGPGTIKATDEKNTCIFCHTVHKTTGQTPLWSHQFSAVTNYTVYSSARLQSLNVVVPQPDGSSRLCLSCHDGTVALGMVSSRTSPIQMQNSVTTMPTTSTANLGTDLSGDHPISFVYDQTLASTDTSVKDPTTLDKRVKLDPQSKVQCTSCHNPHDDQYGSFLVMDNSSSALCLVCHVDSSWGSSAHGISSASLAPQVLKLGLQKSSVKAAAAAAKTVAANACANCHVSHKAGSKERLLIQAKEEQNCFSCHDGTVVKKNLMPEFRKASAHPVLEASAGHKMNENLINAPRHVACADCHNAHAANATSAVAPNAPGALAGVRGVNAAGAIADPIGREYELCFRCHADSPNRGPSRVTRQFPETNKRIQFNTGNASFHPVETLGRNRNVPSLLTPWTASSQMYCTDCHNNDQGPRAGGAGPDGPHGSTFTPILERQQVLTDHNPESAANYALCYKCHSRDSILSDQSFRVTDASGVDHGHRFHIVDAKAACTTCHDSHGVATVPHLINFNTTYVTASSNGRLEYISSGTGSGTCSLTCHGKDHIATTYAPAMLAPRIHRRAR